MKNPVYFFLFLYFCVINLLDLISTFFILPGEANPIYLITKSIWGLIAVKIILCIIIFLVYKANKYPNNIIYFLYISILVYGSLIMTFAVYNNFSIYLSNPQAIIDAAKMPVQTKIEAYKNFIFIYYLAPLLLQMISFIIFEKSIRDVIISKHK